MFVIPPAHAETIRTNGDISGLPITIDITEGKHWKHIMWVSKIIPVWNRPQIAVWAETPDGDFIATLYVTCRSATQDWRGGNVAGRNRSRTGHIDGESNTATVITCR